MEHHNFQRRRSDGIPQREDSEQLPQEFIPTYSTQNIQTLNPSPHHLYQGHPTSEQAVNPGIPRAQQLPQQTTPVFSSQNIQPLNPSPHHQLQGQPSSEQAVNASVHPAISLWQYHSSAELPTPNYETLHQSQPQTHQVQSRSPAGHDPAPMFQHEQYIHASTRARPVSEIPSQNIQLTYPSQQFRALARDRFRTEPHQYHPPQMPTPEVQPSLLQGVDMTSHAQDQSTQPFSQGGSYMIAGQSIQQSYLPSQHQLQQGQPLAQQETGRLHYGNKGTSSQYLHQGSGVMAQNIHQPRQQLLRHPPAHQATDSVKQRKTFNSPEQQLEQHQKSQMPFQDIQQPVSYQQSESPLQRGTKTRKHQHSPERIFSQLNLSESDQTSMRNFSETFGKLPQSEHSSHHEGVASSSAGSEVSGTDVTRHGVSMSPLYQKLKSNQTVIEQEAQDKFLKSKGLYRHHIIPDGNSLYRAIAESFYGDQSRHNDLREKAVKYARENLFQSQHASEGDAELYAALDRSTKENILSHLLGVPIHVLIGGGDSRTEPKFHTHSPGNTDTERPIYISWLSIGHYDAVVSNANPNEVYIKWLEQQMSIMLQHGNVKEASTHVKSYHMSLKGE
ncbi:uncharacterized protein [Ptychodera flava]|uniref:uncharacterized protein n=1 Tax=Ptychodera flava TaxID=63121 RepID=UPI003969EC85